MSLISQQISNPFGITVFGSSLIRVPPDVAVLNFSVMRTRPTPQEAFEAVHEGTRTVRQYLAETEVDDVQSSRVTLSQKFSGDYKKREFIGYEAIVDFTVLVTNIELLETLLIGVVNAGVNSLGNVNMQTTQLKQLRARARQQAVAAAQEKAQLYCESANVTLGSVLHIEDVDPNQVLGGVGHSARAVPIEESEAPKAFDPGSISVRAAVLMSFSLNT